MKTAFESRDGGLSTFVVGVDDGSEPLLSCGVPNLQFYDFVINFHGLEPEVDSDGDHIVFVELIISKSQE